VDWFREKLPRETRAVASEVRKEVSDDRLTGLAAEMAFFVVLSVFPGLIVLAATLGSLDSLVGQEVAAEAQDIVIDFLRRILTDEASPVIEVAQDLFTEQRGGVVTVSLLGSFWSLTRGFTAMGADLVVIGDEAIDLALELLDRFGARLFAQELLLRLMEALDLATGLRVIGARVFVGDAQVKQLGLECRVTVAIRGGEHGSVIG
jgi:hypothetical protein